MSAHFANRLATETWFAVLAVHVVVAAAFGIGMALATIVYALIG
jgi:hypothetical protein